jgi:hypothetical protein
MVQARSNPLAPGLYRIDLFSPTPQSPEVRDGVPIFGKWRKANAAHVRVLECASWSTDPRQTRVQFEVVAPPGAFPFGQLGLPESLSSVGSIPLRVIEFLLNPLLALEVSAAKAAGRFVAVSQPELQGLRSAIIFTRANIAIIRATVDGVRNGTAPHPEAALAACADLAKQSLAQLAHATLAIPIAFPREVIHKLQIDLEALIKAIADAPAKALRLVADVAVPFEVANIGLGVVLIGGLWALSQGKVSPATRNVMLLGGAALVLGGGTFLENLMHPKV